MNQTYQDFELIILDDCSTDRSKEILEVYRDHPKVKQIVYNEVNSGTTFKQWQKGLSLANGDLIWIAESDDYCNSTFLEEAVHALTHYHISLFFSRSYQVDENENVLNDYLWWMSDLPKYDWKKDFLVSGNVFVKDCLAYKNVIVNASAVVFKKKDMNDTFSVINHLKKCGDWLFWASMIKGSSIFYCATPLNYFREHQRSTRNLSNLESVLVRWVEEYYVKERLFKLYRDNAILRETNRVMKQIVRSTPFYKYKFLCQILIDITNHKISFTDFLIKKVAARLRLGS